MKKMYRKLSNGDEVKNILALKMEDIVKSMTSDKAAFDL